MQEIMIYSGLIIALVATVVLIVFGIKVHIINIHRLDAFFVD